ncbi:MAG: nucleotidyltransferase family protein [Nanoarchaeota archaeon]|nr:nucleotidyltransferase family protein [Nanoarchaeota archaeon]
MRALILAGGFGTRLKTISGDTPKSMMPIVGKPFLHHQIRTLRDSGIEEVVLAVHYGSDKIKDYFGNGKRQGVDITYSEEDIPLGTGGAVKNAEKFLGNERFFVLNGDTYTGLDLKQFLDFHNKSGRECSMGVVKVSNSEHHEIVEKDEQK